MSDPSYPHHALADLPGVPFQAIRKVILAQAEAGKLQVLEDGTGRLTVATAHGLVGLRPGAASETAGMVAAEDARWLFVMKNAVVQQMRAMMPEVAEAMRWSDGDTEGSLPGNFQFVRVRDVEDLGAVFLRVTLEGEDLSHHGDASIHFRLVQPPKDAKPEWPSVAANGSIRWPDGDGAPHKPVYTTRSVDHAAGTLVTDVFVHEGGRTTEWAREVQSGGRERTIVGLVGPSGGGLLDADRLLMATDETGFPAAARLLENLPHGATGEIFLESEHGAECGYPIAAPEGSQMHWLARSRGQNLLSATQEAMAAHPQSHIWFAGEKRDARTLRDTAKADGWDAAKLRISGFWSAPA
ncbi:MAG: siderophore-interacting protein [Pseudomonadota bacterium]